MPFDIDVNSRQQKASVAKSKLENHGKCFLPDAMLNMESWEPDFFLFYCMVHVDVVASPDLIAQLIIILLKIQARFIGYNFVQQNDKASYHMK